MRYAVIVLVFAVVGCGLATVDEGGTSTIAGSGGEKTDGGASSGASGGAGGGTGSATGSGGTTASGGTAGTGGTGGSGCKEECGAPMPPVAPLCGVTASCAAGAYLVIYRRGSGRVGCLYPPVGRKTGEFDCDGVGYDTWCLDP